MRSLKPLLLVVLAAAMVVILGTSPLLGGEEKYDFAKPEKIDGIDEKEYSYEQFFQNGPEAPLEFSSAISDQVMYLDGKITDAGLVLEGGIYKLLPPKPKEKEPKKPTPQPRSGKCMMCHDGSSSGGGGSSSGGGQSSSGGGGGGTSSGGGQTSSGGTAGGTGGGAGSGSGLNGAGGGSLPPTADPGREGAVCPIAVKDVDKIDLTRFEKTFQAISLPCGAGKTTFRIRLNIPNQKKDPSFLVVIVEPPSKPEERLYLEYKILKGKAPKRK